ncbi:MAG: NAD(+)/NADH kinase, partial [Desulfobacterales bacterium]
MKPVGIIANPASGKDIRRLVACGSVFDNHEKINIVRRLLRAMDAVGVREVVVMPDYFNIGPRALEDLDVALKVSFLEMFMTGTQDDSTRAAAAMAEMGVAVIVTLGGDGTNRVVAKTCGTTPLLPISTGTNNVFPLMVEGTLAGLVAGIVSMNTVPLDRVCRRAPRLEVRRHSKLVDIALVDVVVSKSGFIATRAIWDVSTLKEIFLTRCEPGNIGFSSVGGLLCPLPPADGKGLHIVLGPGQHRVKAPIAPGLISWLPIQSHRVFGPGEDLPILPGESTIALDGEREIVV